MAFQYLFLGRGRAFTHYHARSLHIIDNLNDVEVKRSKPSIGYSGYSFKVTIYLSDGNEADDWNNFIINSDDRIRKDPFFYSVTKGKIDYNYIENIVE